MHTRSLAPLSLGDNVFVQNQRGSHPNKWDKSGIVVELGNYDQYWVKIDGSGRLTNVEEQAFLAEVRPTITDYWRSPVPLAPSVRPSNQGFITINEERFSPNDDSDSDL